MPVSRHLLAYLLVCSILSTFTACDNQDKGELDDAPVIKETAVDMPEGNGIDYELLQQKIAYGQANLVEINQALTAPDSAVLTNIIHGMYSMRWLRGAQYILDDMWHLKKDNHPDYNWVLIEQAPARLALASTLNRIKIIDTDEYLSYLRSFKYDELEFNRAQVVVAMGFNGDPSDLDYIREMADGDNHYVAQSAITSLALFGGNRARNIMIELWEKHGRTGRGQLLLDLLKKTYKWQPPTEEKS